MLKSLWTIITSDLDKRTVWVLVLLKLRTAGSYQYEGQQQNSFIQSGLYAIYSYSSCHLILHKMASAIS